MTTLTGTTKQTLAGTVDPPTFGAAMAGSAVQFSVLAAVWLKCTPLGSCASELTAAACVSQPWARQVLITLALNTMLWLYSLRTIPTTGTSDPSIVDRMWSILPFLYAWHLYLSSPTPRLLLMAMLATVWGVRLTINFALKGGFSGGEDYRWAEIRSWPGFDKGWEIFNLGFICGFQQLVILAFTSPAAAALGTASTAPLNLLDLLAALLFALLVLGEATADRQMMRFQTEKYRRRKAGVPLGDEYSHGFVKTGLWAYSRHPNYFCEVSIWWAFYLFSIAAGEPLINWTICGPFFLTCLFVLPHASLDTTEVLSSRKYAAYAEYQRTVSRFFPLPPKPAGVPPPLSAGDIGLVCWFVLGTLITYFIDMEQVLVTNPALYGVPGPLTPRWPPAACVRAVHWWGGLADKLVLARPMWFQIAIWLEVVVQAPFYMLAIFAFLRRANWIRIPAIVYSTVLLTIMPMVLGEQYAGAHATDKPLLVTTVYSAYVIMPIIILYRVRHPILFASYAPAPKASAAKASAAKASPKASPAAKATGAARRSAVSPKRGR